MWNAPLRASQSVIWCLGEGLNAWLGNLGAVVVSRTESNVSCECLSNDSLGCFQAVTTVTRLPGFGPHIDVVVVWSDTTAA